MIFGNSKLISKCYTLKCDTLRIEEYSRHDRDYSLINDQQSILENGADLCAFHEALH
jgi:hypothetical protein